MMNDQARVSLMAQGTGGLACELCTAEANVPNATVAVHHPRGGTVDITAPLPPHMRETWSLFGFDPDKYDDGEAKD